MPRSELSNSKQRSKPYDAARRLNGAHSAQAIMAILEGLKGVPTLVLSEPLRTISEAYEKTTSDIDELEARGMITKDHASVCRRKLDKRRQLRVVLSPFGSPSREFRYLRELHTMIGVVDALDKLHGQEILHRDISLRNILLSDVEDEHGEPDGLVTDLDCAIDNAIRSKAAAPHGTGTFLFLAIELINTAEKVVHKYYHDLETVFYALCYLCCTRAGPHGAPRRGFKIAFSPLQFWFLQKTRGRDMEGTTYSKSGVIVYPTNFEAYILRSVAPYFDQPATRTCLEGLRALLFPTRLGVEVREAHLLAFGYIAFDRLPRAEREPKDFFAAYRKILQTAYDNVREPTPLSAALSTGTDVPFPSQAKEALGRRLLDSQEVKYAHANAKTGSIDDRFLSPAAKKANMLKTHIDIGNVVLCKRKKESLDGDVDTESPLAKRAKSEPDKPLVGTRFNPHRALETMFEKREGVRMMLANERATRGPRSKASSQSVSPVVPESNLDLSAEPRPLKRITRSMTRTLLGMRK